MRGADTETTASRTSAPRRAEYLGDPTLGRVMLRPRWLLALLAALAIAAVFAWLGRWQLESAIDGASTTIETETVQPLSEITGPGVPVPEVAGGAVVEASGVFEPSDFGVVSPRLNGDEKGAWVVGHLLTPDPESSHLVVAVGWAADEQAADRAIDALQSYEGLEGAHHFEGRYMPGESAITPHADDDPLAMRSMVPGFVINTWGEVDSPVYAGFLVLHPEGAEQLLEAAGLEPIDSVPPEANSAVNWLNAFYAIEWIVFAGAAIFMWYRLARDAWEKEHELKRLQQNDAAGDGASSSAPEAGTKPLTPAQPSSADPAHTRSPDPGP